MAQVTDFKCNNCGAPLIVPKNARKVICPYCYTECNVEGNVVNAEVLNKENIAGGLVHCVSDAMIQKAILDAVAKSESIPLDVYDNMQIVSVKRVAIPCFWFDNVSGTGTCSYERGIDREQQVIKGSGENLRSETRVVTEWTPQSFSVNASYDFIVSGNKEYESALNNMYISEVDPDVVDVDEMDFGADVQILPFNNPEGTAFNRQVKPFMEGILQNRAADQLPSDGKYRNVSFAGASVHRDTVKRIMVGLYHITYTYGGETYTLYLNHDGSSSCYDKIPVDPARKAQIEQKQAEINAMRANVGGLKAASIIGFILGGILTFSGMVSCGNSKGGAAAILLILGLGLIGGAIVATVFKSKKNKAVAADKARAQEALEQFKYQVVIARNNFEASGRKLNGLEAFSFDQNDNGYGY